MAATVIRIIFILLILLLACEDVNRIWDNPYDPRSDRTLWTPDSLSADTSVEGKITLNWQRKGRDFDGFRIDRKIGEYAWVDSVATLWDSTYTWEDDLNMKMVIGPNAYFTYRLYAYADTNRSNVVMITVDPLVPDPPGPLQVTSINYEDIPPKTLTVKWTKSSDGDFKFYRLYHAEKKSSERKLYNTISDINKISMDTTNFTVLKENWFWIGVVDTMDRETIGDGLGIPVDPPPPAVVLDSVTYANKQFHFKWTQSSITDFSNYTIEQITLPDSTVVNSDTTDLIGTSSTAIAAVSYTHLTLPTILLV